MRSGRQESPPVTAANDEEMMEDGDIKLDIEDEPMFPPQFELDRELIKTTFGENLPQSQGPPGGSNNQVR